MTEELDPLREASQNFVRLSEQTEEARQEVFQQILSALRNGQRPVDVADASPFKEAYVRRLARANGIDPAKPRHRRNN
ncbi:hypothetical protein ACFWU5_16740 [Nocardia sp. NPDC058640]|uniref:hypothetical protein n=1 Tax=Nocardia sp. NPDC058640 TaxID=3346571 RepID=UPI0036615AC6